MDLEKELNKTDADLDDKPLTFGKYKGKTPDYVSDFDPEYLVWLWEKGEIKHCSKAMYEFCLKETQEE
jgi:uncharacterized protein (DUF3820 family)